MKVTSQYFVALHIAVYLHITLFQISTKEIGSLEGDAPNCQLN
jgi:hypothetical protein